MEKKWFAVYTRPRWEKKVSELLTKRKIENYCPLNKVKRQWSDRKKIVQEPLFTSYVFVRINEMQQSEVKAIDGIVNMVYWLGKPAVIRDIEIEMIKRFLEEHVNVQIEKTAVNVNDIVRVISGPLIDNEGQIRAVSNKSVKLTLPSLGYMMMAEVELSKIEIINTYSGESKKSHGLYDLDYTQ